MIAVANKRQITTKVLSDHAALLGGSLEIAGDGLTGTQIAEALRSLLPDISDFAAFVSSSTAMEIQELGTPRRAADASLHPAQGAQSNLPV